MRVDGIAGLIRFNDDVEMEIVPKFLDPRDPRWRNDFFHLAVLVKTGYLLASEEIEAGNDTASGMATLVAQALLRMHQTNERRPIRTYQRVASTDFSVDGDVDWESLLLPDDDGFHLNNLAFTRKNPYNAVLSAALRRLVPEVPDTDMQAQLSTAARTLLQQLPPPRNPPALPQRHRAWDAAYKLSRFVLDGMGLSYTENGYSGPGFVVSTWAAWEDLCEILVGAALKGWRVRPQQSWKLGMRMGKVFWATPDISVLESGTASGYLLDAKYKTRLGREPKMGRADIYEALAFLRSSQTGYIGLLYPSTKSREDLATGVTKVFDEVRIDGELIEGIEVQIQGIAEPEGFSHLVSGVRHELDRAMSRHEDVQRNRVV
jgi:5-methylcytosine-specific restriction endonuclease McrBC regulatory subunit McrC